jgi:hypothetical protein
MSPTYCFACLLTVATQQACAAVLLPIILTESCVVAVGKKGKRRSFRKPSVADSMRYFFDIQQIYIKLIVYKYACRVVINMKFKVKCCCRSTRNNSRNRLTAKAVTSSSFMCMASSRPHPDSENNTAPHFTKLYHYSSGVSSCMLLVRR